jgi:hypothetical protein
MIYIWIILLIKSATDSLSTPLKKKQPPWFYPKWLLITCNFLKLKGSGKSPNPSTPNPLRFTVDCGLLTVDRPSLPVPHCGE